MTFTNHTKNQEIIYALIKGQTVQLRGGSIPEWYDFDLEFALENEDPFGPWNCADCYEWRIKPKTKEITVEVTVKKTLTLEGVKSHRYKAGEQLFFIAKCKDGYKTNKYVPLYDNNDTFESEVIFFENEEAMNKAYEQILNAQKGL